MTDSRPRPEEEQPRRPLERAPQESRLTADTTEVEEEGQAYRPPDDPPIAAAPDGEPRVAAGFGGDAQSEPFDQDHHRTLTLEDDEATEQVREALLADSLGSEYVDRLRIERRGGVVLLEGVVDDIDMQEHLLDVASAVSGVTEVVDRLVLPEAPAGDLSADTRNEP